MDSPTLLQQMRDLGLWPDEEASRQALLSLLARFPDGRQLARELLQRNLLTPYQANQILTGNGASLVVGSYLILERLGEGGMGQVYKARHLRLGRVIALKLIRPTHVKNPTAVGRFLREVEAVAHLSHPNIVRAYDAGQAGEGYYFAMEYVDGLDLSRLVKREGRLAVDRACDYILQAANGLQHVHEQGLIHRDLKPSNLMVGHPCAVPKVGEEGPPSGSSSEWTGPWGQVKILDLGLARLTEDAADGPRPALTRLGVVTGTVEYMAPEQALHSRHADARSDIYGLGCTFYMILAGQPPFLKTGDPIEVIMKHQMDPIPPVEELRPGVPPEVLAVLARMLAKKPDQRYQTAEEVAAALMEAGELVLARTALPVHQPAMATASVAATLLQEEPQPGSDFVFDEMEDAPVQALPVGRMRSRPAEWRTWGVFAAVAVGVVVVLTVLLKMLLH